MSSGEVGLEVEGSVGHNDQNPSPVPLEDEEPKRLLKPPDSKKFEREIEKLNGRIREKESQLQSLQRPSPRSRSSSNSSSHAWKDRETLLAELRGYKSEKEKDMEARRKIDLELRGLTTLVQQKNDACGKAQAGLKYKNEAKTDEAIRRLEHQLRVQQLKLREEKRIVTEIDALRRSKKLIHEFVALKQVLDQLRDRQRSLRSERDTCTRRINGLKAKEDEIKNVLDEQKSKADEVRSLKKETETERTVLKKEIDELYTSKRELVAAFNKDKSEYFHSMKEAKQLITQKRKYDASRRVEGKRVEQTRERKGRTISPPHPYEAELVLCTTLIEYMGRLCATHQVEGQTASDDAAASPSPEPPHQSADASSGDGMFLKKKKDDDLTGMFAGLCKRNSKRGSKKNRRSIGKETPKKLVLHPHVVEQFWSLHLSPPSSAADIPRALHELVAKKDYFTTAAVSTAAPESLSGPPSVDSSTPSSIAEDFPSLPPPPSSVTPDSMQNPSPDILDLHGTPSPEPLEAHLNTILPETQNSHQNKSPEGKEPKLNFLPEMSDSKQISSRDIPNFHKTPSPEPLEAHLNIIVPETQNSHQNISQEDTELKLNSIPKMSDTQVTASSDTPDLHKTPSPEPMEAQLDVVLAETQNSHQNISQEDTELRLNLIPEIADTKQNGDDGNLLHNVEEKECPEVGENMYGFVTDAFHESSDLQGSKSIGEETKALTESELHEEGNNKQNYIDGSENVYEISTKYINFSNDVSKEYSNVNSLQNETDVTEEVHLGNAKAVNQIGDEVTTNGDTQSESEMGTENCTENEKNLDKTLFGNKTRKTEKDTEIIVNGQDSDFNTDVTNSVSSEEITHAKLDLSNREEHVTVYSKGTIESAPNILSDLNEDIMPASMKQCEKCPA